MGHGLHGHSWSLAALHGPHPALVQEVTGQRSQSGGSCPVSCHAEGHGAVGGLQKVIHVENEGSSEVQRQLLISAKTSVTASCNQYFYIGNSNDTTSSLFVHVIHCYHET